MSDDIKKIANAWMKMSAAHKLEGKNGPDYKANFWAFEAFDDLIHKEPEKAWPIILAIYNATDDESILANLAAGPLEDLLVQHGEKFIDRVEQLARQDEKFLYVLSGVWGWSSMPKDLLDRVASLTKKSKRHM